MWDRNPVRLTLVHMLPAIAEARGVPLAPLLARAGLPDRFMADGVVARAQVCTLLHGLARSSGDAAIGLDLAGAADPTRLGMVGRALFAGATLRACLDGHAWQMPSLQGGVSVTMHEQGGRVRLRHRLADSEPGHAQVLNEGIAAFLVRAIRVVGGDVAGGLHVHLPHRAQAPARTYEDRLQADVSFGAGDWLELSFDPAWLDRPNPLCAPRQPVPAETLLAQDRVWIDDAGLIAALNRIIEGAALGGAPSLLDATRTLGLAPRSLQRRLAGLDTSFEALVDGWRHAQARHHLTGSAEPVGSVARALGYRHAAHFVRAFHRWEGTTPLAYRRAHLARHGN